MRLLVPIALNQLLTVLLGLVGVKLISTFVPPAVNGPYSLFLTLTQLGVLLTHSGIVNHASRYWQREQVKGGTYLRFLWSATLRTVVYLAPVLLLISFVLLWCGDEPAWKWSFLPLL